jgi:L-arabinose isomerase
VDITSPTKKAKVGILYAGHRRYWGQFAGSREATVAAAQRFADIVRESPVEVVMPDLVDTTELSFAAGRQLEQAGIDLLFVYLHTYVASGFWVPGVKHLNVPIVLVTLTESFDFDTEYITGTAIRRGSPCQVPEAYSALLRVGKPAVDVVLGDHRDPRPRREIGEWCRVANALRTYRDSALGYLGHTYDGMLDMNFDPTAVTGAFGIYCRMLEVCELAEHVQSTTPAEVAAKIDEMHQVFDFEGKSGDPLTQPATEEAIAWTAKCAVGLDKLVAKHNLAGLAYYYEGENDNLYERIGANLIVGNTLLTSRGISLAGEADMRTCIAMKTTSALGAGGSFAELSVIDYEKNQVYVGHDGPHDLRITDGRPCIRGLSLYHGKKGTGVAVEFGIKKGPITMVSLALDGRGQFKFVVAEGESMPGRLPQIANTVTRGYFGDDVAAFLRAWSMSGISHHMSLCVGHIAPTMVKLGKAMNLPVEIIPP